MGFQHVMIMGNLGRDPEMRYTASGLAQTTFSVAVTEYWTNDSGKNERTEWFNVVCWNKTAETASQYLEKGRPICIEGRMQTRSWEGQDGKKNYRTELIADKLHFVGAKPNEKGGGSDLDPEDLPFGN